MKTKLIPPPQYPNGKYDNKPFRTRVIGSSLEPHKARLQLIKHLDATRHKITM